VRVPGPVDGVDPGSRQRVLFTTTAVHVFASLPPSQVSTRHCLFKTTPYGLVAAQQVLLGTTSLSGLLGIERRLQGCITASETPQEAPVGVLSTLPMATLISQASQASTVGLGSSHHDSNAGASSKVKLRLCYGGRFEKVGYSLIRLFDELRAPFSCELSRASLCAVILSRPCYDCPVRDGSVVRTSGWPLACCAPNLLLLLLCMPADCQQLLQVCGRRVLQ
jgi:hypothetical protein